MTTSPHGSHGTAPRRRASSWPVLTGGGLVALVSLVHLYGDALGAMLTTLLPALQERFGLSETQLAVLVAIQWLSTSVSQPLLGGLSDRFSAARVAAVGSLLCAGLLSLMPVAPTASLLMLVLLLGGLGSAAFHPAAAAMARQAGGTRSDLAVSLFSAGGTIGIALGPVLVITLVSSYGLGYTPWLGVPAVVLAGALWLGARDSPDRAATVRRPNLNLGLLRGPIGMLSLATILAGVGVISFTNSVVLWLATDRGLPVDDPAIGWTLATFSLASASGGILAGLLARRVPRAWLVAGTLSLAVIPFNLVFHVTPDSAAYFAVIAAAGALAHASYPILIVSAQHLAVYAAATAAALVMGFATGIAGVLYIAVGALQEVTGLEAAMRLTSLALLPAAWVAFRTLQTHFHGANGLLLGQTICACVTCRCNGCSVAATHLSGTPQPI